MVEILQSAEFNIGILEIGSPEPRAFETSRPALIHEAAAHFRTLEIRVLQTAILENGAAEIGLLEG